ncbi:hypothetical protein E4L96_06850 [Massilia arenosa]|uniref:Uncharacterized protein n=1 Tax=Zemynaea arenosa TaxID=2561931 RepID=A0A4Y9SM58_9BURK|nr:hypothetical protein [Massilia arenosa]TFW23275.1 hypothetical protein E4L96_06850 [Massilia arenosa]
MEHESHHHHHPHGTGMRWLDITLGVAATIVSLVSLWLGLHSAHSMEKLVTANSYPYVELMRSSAALPQPGEQIRRRMVEYELDNNGIGPARIEWVVFNFNGKPMRDLTDLMDACCNGADINGMNLRGNVTGALIRPGGRLPMFTWNEPATPDPAFDALNKQMDKIDFTACYCSVFDECYTRSTETTKPEPVKACVAPATPFQPRTHKRT